MPVNASIIIVCRSKCDCHSSHLLGQPRLNGPGAGVFPSGQHPNRDVVHLECLGNPNDSGLKGAKGMGIF